MWQAWVVGACFVLAGVFILWFLLSEHTAPNRMNMKGDLMLPDHWDEKQIDMTLRHFRGEPKALAHYVDSIKTRFIERQNVKTAKQRIKFLEQAIAALKLGKEFYSLQAEIRRLRDEEDIKDLDVAKRKRAAEKSLQHQEELDDAEHAVRMAELKRRYRDAERAATPPPAPGSEREKKVTECKQRIAKLESEKAAEMAKAGNEDHRRRIENIYDNAIERAYDDLSKCL